MCETFRMNGEELTTAVGGGKTARRRARTRFADEVRSQMRRAVLDAVGKLLGNRAWAGIRMIEVARAAGVSRQTVYQMFGSRDELIRAYVLRESEQFADKAAQTLVSRADNPDEAVEFALRDFLAAASAHPVVKMVISGQDDNQLVEYVTTHGEAVLTMATDRLTQAVLASWPSADPYDAKLITETVVRLAISHLALPTAPPEVTAAAVGRLLRPFVHQALNLS
jgi:AcrR family transcriptional regulator